MTRSTHRSREKAQLCKCGHPKHGHARGSDLSWSGECHGFVVTWVAAIRTVEGCECGKFELAEKLGGEKQ
jgi:hypothetical protein